MRKVFLLIGLLIFFLSSCSQKTEIVVSYETNYNFDLSIQLFENNLDLNMLPILDRDGHEFLGWYLDSNFNDPVSNFKITDNNLEIQITLFAKWKLIDKYEEFEIDLIRFNGIEGIEITNYIGHEEVLTIPDDIYGYKVISIGRMAFYEKDIKTLFLNESLLKIGLHAFFNNQINEISFGNQLFIIEAGAFSNNQIEHISFPDTIQGIGSYAFQENKLKSITLPSQLVFLGSSAFSWNELISVNIPAKLTEINDFAFGWNQISELIIPENILKIGQSSFEANPIEKITVIGEPFRFNLNWEIIGFPTSLKFEYINKEQLYLEYSAVGANISEVHPFLQVNFLQLEGKESLNNLINSGNLIILYIGSPQCPACVQTIGTVSDYFFSEGMETLTPNIYYYEDFVGAAATRDRNAFLEAFPDITRTTPQIIAFLDGEIIARYQAPTEGVTIERQVKNFFTAVLDQVS